MKDKILIFDQNYDDPASFYHIIDKGDLEAYTQNYIQEFLQKQQKRIIVFDYLSHNIDLKQCTVRIKFLRHAYQVLNSNYEEGFEYRGFDFVDLDKIPTWKTQPKALQVKIKESEPYVSKDCIQPTAHPNICSPHKPISITLDDIVFSQSQIVSSPQIQAVPVYITDFESEYNYMIPPRKILARVEYESATFKIRASIKQMKQIREVFATTVDSTNVLTRRKIQHFNIKWEDKTISAEGYVRDMSFTAFDHSEEPIELEIELCFLINNLFIE